MNAYTMSDDLDDLTKMEESFLDII